MSEHYDKIKEIIIDKLGVQNEKITMEAKFIEDLGADSLDTVELIMQFEEEFGIEIPDDDAEGLLSVGQAIDYIASKGKPVLIATGASTMEEVKLAIGILLNRTKNIVLMQCNTNYTASHENFKFINLNVLKT